MCRRESNEWPSGKLPHIIIGYNLQCPCSLRPCCSSSPTNLPQIGYFWGPPKEHNDDQNEAFLFPPDIIINIKSSRAFMLLCFNTLGEIVLLAVVVNVFLYIVHFVSLLAPRQVHGQHDFALLCSSPSPPYPIRSPSLLRRNIFVSTE